MPTVFRSGPYRVFFFSADREEPRHVHVQRDRSWAKVWLDPVQLEDSAGFRSHELGTIEALVIEQAEFLRKAWDEFFGV